MTDAHLTPHGKVLVQLADELRALAREYREEVLHPDEEDEDEIDFIIDREDAENFAARLDEAARTVRSISTEILSIQTGRE